MGAHCLLTRAQCNGSPLLWPRQKQEPNLWAAMRATHRTQEFRKAKQNESIHPTQNPEKKKHEGRKANEGSFIASTTPVIRPTRAQEKMTIRAAREPATAAHPTQPTKQIWGAQPLVAADAFDQEPKKNEGRPTRAQLLGRGQLIRPRIQRLWRWNQEVANSRTV